ncbi:hypothetical protein [Thermus caliditerrae]|uniref:hypothetical protein n=1 Tax=Thermus caliditerrae TaxID=1330700 RepID=UPI001F27DB28|nr:hypothetical protein [Thermus caliditerrae]
MNRKRWLALALFALAVGLLVLGVGSFTHPQEAARPWRETTLYGRGEKVLLLELRGTIPTDKDIEEFLSQARQAWRDLIADTLVVRVGQEEQQSPGT